MAVLINFVYAVRSQVGMCSLYYRPSVRLPRGRCVLGLPIFLGALVVFCLMVAKPTLGPHGIAAGGLTHRQWDEGTVLEERDRIAFRRLFDSNGF